MAKIAVIDARKDLAEILNRAAYGKERVVLTRRGKDVAAIVPMDDLNILEAIEDHMDVTDSEKILARVRAGSEQLVSLEEVKAKYQENPKPTKKAPKARKGCDRIWVELGRRDSNPDKQIQSLRSYRWTTSQDTT